MISIASIVQASSIARARKFNDIRNKFPAQYFLPNKPQAEFIKAVGNLTPDNRIFLVTSGNGTGKTTVSVNITQNLVYPNCNLFRNITDVQTGEKYSGFFDYPLFNKWPKDWPKVIWYVSNTDSLKSICKEFDKWVNPDDVQKTKEGKSSLPWSRMTFRSNNWEIALKTVDQDPKTFESANVGMVIFDEPPPLMLYRAAVSRLRSGGIILIPATPLFGAGWFVDDIIDKIDEDGDKWHQTVSVYENCIEKAGEWDCGIYGVQKKGNLYLDNIEFTLRNYDEDELEARRDGVFKHLTGVVYKSYAKDNIVSKRSLTYTPEPKRYNYRMIIDPHGRRPPAITWMRYDAYGRREYIREWPSIHDDQFNHKMYHKIKDASPYIIKDFVKIGIQIEKQLGIPSDRMFRIMDKNYGAKRNEETGRTIAEDYQFAADELRKKDPSIPDNWHFFMDYSNNIIAGQDKVKESLKPTPNGEFMMKFDPDCRNLDYAMRNYSWDDLTMAMSKKKETTEKVKEIAKDFADCIRYDHMVELDFSDLPISRDPYEGTDFDEVKPQKNTYDDGWRSAFKTPDDVERPPGASGV